MSTLTRISPRTDFSAGLTVREVHRASRAYMDNIGPPQGPIGWSTATKCQNASESTKAAQPYESINKKLSKSGLLSLSDQVSEVHRASSAYVDNTSAIGRFRFWSFLNKLKN